MGILRRLFNQQKNKEMKFEHPLGWFDVSRWKKQHLTDRRRVTFFQVCELFQMDVWVLCMFWYLHTWHTCTIHVKFVLRIFSDQLDGDIGEWIQEMNLNRDFSNTFSRRVIDILEISLPFGNLT
jgi:hypothetical protein